MGSSALKQIQENDHHIEAGEGRTLGYQALMQLLGFTTLKNIIKKKRIKI